MYSAVSSNYKTKGTPVPKCKRIGDPMQPLCFKLFETILFSKLLLGKPFWVGRSNDTISV